MPMSLVQIDAQLEAAYDAINVGELSFAGPGGRAVTFHSLDSMTRYITWLDGQRANVVASAAVASGGGGAMVVHFVEPVE